MRVVAGFHTRGDEWILMKKLDVLSRFCDDIVVVLDRPSDLTRDMLRAFPKSLITAIEHKNTLGFPDNDPIRGPLCEEGAMRQEAFDAMAAMQPDYMLLGDTDEIPTPSIVPFLKRVQEQYPDTDVFKFDIVNLYQGEHQYVSGRDCVWSPEHPGSNKRAALLRYDPKRTYKYDVKKPCHVRLEPEMSIRKDLLSCKTLLVPDVKILHYKFADWARWLKTYKAGMQKYQDYWRGLQVSPVPKEWICWEGVK